MRDDDEHQAALTVFETLQGCRFLGGDGKLGVSLGGVARPIKGFLGSLFFIATRNALIFKSYR
jgi:hypothetical protein